MAREVWTLEDVANKLEWEGGWAGLYDYGLPYTENSELNDLISDFEVSLSKLEKWWSENGPED